MKARKVLLILIAVALIIGMTPVSGLAAGTDASRGFSDMPADWSTLALQNAVDNGLLVGAGGKLNPKGNLTRAEMATIISRVFNAQVKGDLSAYTDVKAGEWYADYLAKAYQMQVMQGAGGLMKPQMTISREEVFVIVARALKLEPASSWDKSFSDAGSLAAWSKGEAAALVNAGYLQGADGKLNPQANITRAEFAQLMYNVIPHYIQQAGKVSKDYVGNLMINRAGVTLENSQVTGDLIIGDGVGSGDITLDGVTVTGRLLVRGGGVNSIYIKGDSTIENLIIARVDGQVRVVNESGKEIGVVVIDGSDNVVLVGKFGTVTVLADDITVDATDATISKIVAEGSNTVVKEKPVDSGGGGTVVVPPIDPPDPPVDQTPVAGDYNIGNLAQTVGSVTAVTITAKEGKSSGAVTIKYNGSTELPSAVGSYTVTFDVVAATGWKAATGLVAGTLGITELPPGTLGGTVSVTGTLKYDEPLTADIGLLTGNTGTLSYQWKRGGSDISGATSATYTTVASDIGEKIAVAVTSDVETGTVTGTASGTIAKADGPAAPVVVASENDAENEILVIGGEEKVTVTVGTSMNGVYEYSIDNGSTWTDLEVAAGASGDITGLTSTVTDIQIRVKETATHGAGIVATQTVTVTSAFVSRTDETIANNKDTLGIVGYNVSSSDTSKVTAIIEDGKIKITSVSAGTATITVSKIAAKAEIPVTVAVNGDITIGTITKAEIVITKMEVYERDGFPLKKNYTIGETLDLTNLEIIIEMNDGSGIYNSWKSGWNTCTVSPDHGTELDAIGSIEITLTLKEDTNQTATFIINVSEPVKKSASFTVKNESNEGVEAVEIKVGETTDVTDTNGEVEFNDVTVGSVAVTLSNLGGTDHQLKNIVVKQGEIYIDVTETIVGTEYTFIMPNSDVAIDVTVGEPDKKVKIGGAYNADPLTLKNGSITKDSAGNDITGFLIWSYFTGELTMEGYQGGHIHSGEEGSVTETITIRVKGKSNKITAETEALLFINPNIIGSNKDCDTLTIQVNDYVGRAVYSQATVRNVTIIINVNSTHTYNDVYGLYGLTKVDGGHLKITVNKSENHNMDAYGVIGNLILENEGTANIEVMGAAGTARISTHNGAPWVSNASKVVAAYFTGDGNSEVKPFVMTEVIVPTSVTKIKSQKDGLAEGESSILVGDSGVVTLYAADESGNKDGEPVDIINLADGAAGTTFYAKTTADKWFKITVIREDQE